MEGLGAVVSSSREKEDRLFKKSRLMGVESFEASNGTRVTIYKRGDAFIGRGRYEGSQFGQKLGKTEKDAQASLHRLLYELGEGTFIPPSKKNHQIVRRRVLSECLETRDLVNRFLQHVQTDRGRSTQETYLDRLRPVLEFVEQQENKRRWAKASSIDHDFVIALRNWLSSSPFTTKNGGQKIRTPKTTRNILECLRTCLNWAIKPERLLLPADYVVPVTKDVIGKEAPKDPFRPNPLSEVDKIKIVNEASDEELAVIALFILLADRADELAGLCIEDVDLNRRHLLFGINNCDKNFTKGHTAFRIPYHQNLDGLINRLIAGRTQGPLIRQVSYQNDENNQSVDLVAVWQAEAVKNPFRIRTLNDKKALFREIMRRSGGASSDYIGKLFAKVAKRAGLVNIQPGFCRDSATHLMERSGMSFLTARYLTSHSTTDILNTYTGLNIDSEMGRYFAMLPDLLSVISERFPIPQPDLGELEKNL